MKLARLDANEDELVMASLRDMNIAKLVPADIPLFLSLLTDIFPSVSSTASKSHAGLREVLETVAKKTKVLQWLSFIPRLCSARGHRIGGGVMLFLLPAGSTRQLDLEVPAALRHVSCATRHHACRSTCIGQVVHHQNTGIGAVDVDEAGAQNGEVRFDARRSDCGRTMTMALL